MCNLELNHLFTYKLITEDNDEEKGMREMLYKIQLLQLFDLNELDEAVMNEKMNTLYESIKNEPFITELLQENPYKINFFNNELLFRTLFSYDFLDLFHKCLYNHFNNLPMEESINKLKVEYISK
jgi:DNA-dependent RNA polymerase auxiliary subunit epsilon